MNTDLDSRIVPDRDLNNDDCRIVWTLAMTKVWSDATGMPVRGHDCVAPTQLDQDRAREWLLNPSIDLALVCGALGLDMAYVNRFAAQRALSNWQVQ